MCARQEVRLSQLHFAWNVDQQTAMWHHLLHEARRFKARLGPQTGGQQQLHPAAPGTTPALWATHSLLQPCMDVWRVQAELHACMRGSVCSRCEQGLL